MTKNILFVDGSAGASGDMLLAALLDLGFPQKKLQETLDLLPASLKFKENSIQVNGVAARQITLVAPKSAKKYWKLFDFLEILSRSTLPYSLKNTAAKAFKKLGRVEAKIHGTKPAQLHFHELGAWDTILYVIGVLSGIEYYSPCDVWVGPLNLGSGFIETQHGKLPVPPPAVAALLKNFYACSSGPNTELVTPTGALLLSSIGKPAKEILRMTVKQCGYGIGHKPNPGALCILLGEIPGLT